MTVSLQTQSTESHRSRNLLDIYTSHARNEGVPKSTPPSSTELQNILRSICAFKYTYFPCCSLSSVPEKIFDDAEFQSRLPWYDVVCVCTTVSPTTTEKKHLNRELLFNLLKNKSFTRKECLLYFIFLVSKEKNVVRYRRRRGHGPRR